MAKAKRRCMHGKRRRRSPLLNDKEKYVYQLKDVNGVVIKNITKEEYIKYKNIPGSDRPTKSTNDPDPYGRKKKN
tara:strand:- start:23 stop:247 length:225 start_codon:yes stop_codon:yes gene_type:complete